MSIYASFFYLVIAYRLRVLHNKPHDRTLNIFVSELFLDLYYISVFVLSYRESF